MMPPPPTGRLSGIGVGPGDPDLLTLKAVRRISEAAVVAYPMSDDTHSFARSVAEAHIRPDHHRRAKRFLDQPDEEEEGAGAQG